MSLAELFILAVGLSMDAFAVAVSDGICYVDFSRGQKVATAAAFGVFQGVMPVLGYLAGRTVIRYIERYDHIVALLLLGYLGVSMIVEGVRQRRHPEACSAARFSWKTLLTQAVATSIDALAVGISFAALSVRILPAASFIAAVTFGLSLLGLLLGARAGKLLQSRAQLAGGVILLAIGIKIFLEHTLAA